MSLASAGVGAYAAMQSAKAQNQSLEYNAKVKDYQVQQATALGDIEAKQKRLEVAKLQGSQKAGYAGAGVVVNTDTPLEVGGQTAGYGELDALALKQNRQMQAWGYTSSAAVDRASKINPVTAGATSMLSGVSGIGSSLLNFGMSRVS